MGFTLLIAVGTLTYITLMHILPETYYSEGNEDHDHFGNDDQNESQQDEEYRDDVDGLRYNRLITGEENKQKQLVETLINSEEHKTG